MCMPSLIFCWHSTCNLASHEDYGTSFIYSVNRNSWRQSDIQLCSLLEMTWKICLILILWALIFITMGEYLLSIRRYSQSLSTDISFKLPGLCLIMKLSLILIYKKKYLVVSCITHSHTHRRAHTNIPPTSLQHANSWCKLCFTYNTYIACCSVCLLVSDSWYLKLVKLIHLYSHHVVRWSLPL